MECQMCGCEPADPTSLRPVRELATRTDLIPIGDGVSIEGESYAILGDEIAVCEDCWPEASEPERAWRLENECEECWRPRVDVGEPMCDCPR